MNSGACWLSQRGRRAWYGVARTRELGCPRSTSACAHLKRQQFQSLSAQSRALRRPCLSPHPRERAYVPRVRYLSAIEPLMVSYRDSFANRTPSPQISHLALARRSGGGAGTLIGVVAGAGGVERPLRARPGHQKRGARTWARRRGACFRPPRHAAAGSGSPGRGERRLYRGRSPQCPQSPLRPEEVRRARVSSRQAQRQPPRVPYQAPRDL